MATTIKMPQLGESVTEGTIERWLVKEGDRVEQYDPLFEVVTDKVNAEVPAEVAGTVTRIMVRDGETVKVGTPLAEIDAAGNGVAPQPTDTAASAPAPQEAGPAAAAAAPGEGVPEPQAETPTAQSAGPDPDLSRPAAQEAATPTDGQGDAGSAAPQAGPPSPGGAPPTDATARMTPAVRRLVREHGIDVAQLRGSGAGGRVTRDDVLAFVNRVPSEADAPATPTPAPPAAASPGSEPPAAPTASAGGTTTPAYQPPAAVAAPSGGDSELPMSQMRKAIAAKMTKVKQTVPHAYTVVEVDMGGVVRWREANQAAYKTREGIGISYVAVVVKAVTETLRQHPTLNSQFAEDRVILKQRMNIGIAVAVDNGLIVPVIHDADQLSINGVNRRVQDLAARARSNRLKLDEIQGGTFTVNNTGWFGSVASMPIINAPEVAILSMEAIVKRPTVIEVDGADMIAIRPIMNMTCSFDHRVLDGAQVGFFLADVRKRLEEWHVDTPLG
ncbi:MAG: branched-chain alpha-keto acid dehydrogenase subunit E2 [Chloroflexi bacterium]|nr:MAG: branched-chain alpha-keto acid dehydrogenase subunit E2 [Chloroflexota bacterium]